MVSPDISSDEGEIVEATPLPRSEQNGDVDRSGRRGRLSQTPERDVASRNLHDDYRRRSRSRSRGYKRSRDERHRHDDRRFHVRYETASKDDYRPGRLDRPASRGSYDNERPLPARPAGQRSGQRNGHRAFGREVDRSRDGLPDKRPRIRAESPPSPPERARSDRGRVQWETRPDQSKYSVPYERRSRDNTRSKRTPMDAFRGTKQVTKPEQGATEDRGDDRWSDPHTEYVPTRSAAGTRLTTLRDDGKKSSGEVETATDWDVTVLDPDAAVEAEIQKRRRAREEALKRALDGAAPAALPVQALQTADRAISTPSSTKPNTPGLQQTDTNTPRSGEEHLPRATMLATDGKVSAASPASSAGEGPEVSPAVFDFANDQALINTHGAARVCAEDGQDGEDGPSAADYDPTADMREDEWRDERRGGHTGLHGEPRPSADEALTQMPDGARKDAEDVDDFDMFADDFDEAKYAGPVTAKRSADEDDQLLPANGHAAAAASGGAHAVLEGDDKDGYYKFRPGEMLDCRYQISTTLGRGMFSGVARATDVTTQKAVAIKIMRNNDALRKGGFTEIAILQKLNDADVDNKKHIVKFERSFEYKNHLCMAFENLSMNLREVLKKFGNNVGINLNATRAYAYQIFVALGHMRKCSIIHADLKPDNILVNESRNVLKICDLGTAIDRSDAATASTEITPYLVSRFYRAPEIILGMSYDYAIDMWSIGCTLYELYTGKILFTGDSNNQMLKNIMEVRGRFSPKLYRRGQLFGMHFDDLGQFCSVERDKVTGKTTIKTLPTVKSSRDLRTRLLAASGGMSEAETRELNHFVDLLERCLALNPDRRITPAEALRHPFFTHRMQYAAR